MSSLTIGRQQSLEPCPRIYRPQPVLVPVPSLLGLAGLIMGRQFLIFLLFGVAQTAVTTPPPPLRPDEKLT